METNTASVLNMPRAPLSHTFPARPTIAVLVPCYNEEAAIERVVLEFRAALPEAVIYVYDNNSRDRTQEDRKSVV